MHMIQGTWAVSEELAADLGAHLARYYQRTTAQPNYTSQFLKSATEILKPYLHKLLPAHLYSQKTSSEWYEWLCI